MAYDIADDKRRSKVFKMLFGYGDHAQYSVFFCEMNEREVVVLRRRLRETIHHEEDQVMLVDLGNAVRPLEAGLEVLGKGYNPPVRTLVV